MTSKLFARLRIAMATLLVSGFATAQAPSSDDITVDVGDCVDLPSPAERRACYAARVDAAVQERERDPRPAATDDGAARSEEPVERQAELPADSAEPAEIVAKIAALRETVPNSYLITLDNGQAWRQMRPKWFPLRVGQEVRIYSSSWGDAFRLSVQGLSGFLQVERVD